MDDKDDEAWVGLDDQLCLTGLAKLPLMFTECCHKPALGLVVTLAGKFSVSSFAKWKQ